MRRIRHYHVQILITQRCNAICDHCDKAVGLANLSDIEMTTERMAELVDEILEDGFLIDRLTLSGGEPVVNKDLQGILFEVARLPSVKHFRILTNDLNSTQEKRDAIQLPDNRFSWHPAPLDNLDDPLSGKNDPRVRYRKQVHIPFWISPADIGKESKFDYCSIRKFCGKGLDNVGWTMCGQAPILGRILGIDPYPKEGTITDRVLKPLEEICKHCAYGMKLSRNEQHALLFAQPDPISPTFKKAFGDKPTTFQISTEKI